MHLSPDAWVWIAAILTLFVYSFLYKDNPLYKFAEHLMVGTSMGYLIAIYWNNQFVPNVFDPLINNFSNSLYLIPAVIIGSFYLCRFIPRAAWLVRYPIGLTLGFYSGLSISLVIHAYMYKQIEFTIIDVLNYPAGVSTAGAIFIVATNLMVIIGVISCLVYFYFSIKHVGAVGVVSRIGIVFLMVGFGASFGNTVMARVSLLIGRVGFLLDNWLGLPIIN
ncbi:hypothetical protein ACFL5I_01305 [Planctomycetota bacterium]